jgi:hypothetical protein
MNIVKVLHIISHLRWIFLIWMVSLMMYVFFFNPDNPIQLVGQILFISGIMMGLTSLSDVSKMSKKQIKELSNPKKSRLQLIMLLSGVIIIVLISSLFFSLRLLFPEANADYIKSFTRLGFDCLVMMLGMLCLIKQYTDQVAYAQNQIIPDSEISI